MALHISKKKPQYGYGKPYGDYGLGFYCTEDASMAKEWGATFNGNGYTNHYEIDCEGLDILDLNAPEYTILTWLAVLLENREFDAPSSLAAEAKQYIAENFMPKYKSYDIIEGYRL